MSDPQPESDLDSPWKEAMGRYFEPFLRLFFPGAHAAIDWSRGYEVLDKELQKIVSDAEGGRFTVDLLVKVRLLSGDEQWILIHVEVQSQRREDFPERMFRYHIRIFETYRRPVASFAVLADESVAWRPDHHAYDFLGCRLKFEFPMVKLLDFVDDEAELELSDNPFAVVVLAHLKAQQTAGDNRQQTAVVMEASADSRTVRPGLESGRCLGTDSVDRLVFATAAADGDSVSRRTRGTRTGEADAVCDEF